VRGTLAARAAPREGVAAPSHTLIGGTTLFKREAARLVRLHTQT
jgi:hypothetical protein